MDLVLAGEPGITRGERLLPVQVTVMHAPETAAAQAGPDPVREALAALLRQMGLDAANYSTPEWNPFGAFLKPGQTVVIKPNLVHHRHYGGGRLEWVVTDPRLIRAVCHHVFQAVGREGTVVIGDAPLQSANWATLLEQTGLGELPGYYQRRGYHLMLCDFRRLGTIDLRGIKCAPRPLAGDPKGYRAVDLGADSLHAGRDWNRFRVTNYDPAEMLAHHNAERHEYLIAGSILAADAVINLPKLKTHRKAGLTCALKNMVGINGNKDWLPHHSVGDVSAGGDEYRESRTWKRLTSWILEREESRRRLLPKLAWNALRKVVWKVAGSFARDRSSEGSWYGNDTLWRTILDLNRAALYANAAGEMCAQPQRTILTIVDAMTAGEGEGPMAPRPAPLGCLIAGANPLAVDVAAARLARWPEGALKSIAGAWDSHTYPLAGFAAGELDIRCFGASGDELPLASISRWLAPSEGFRGLFEKGAAG